MSVLIALLVSACGQAPGSGSPVGSSGVTATGPLQLRGNPNFNVSQLPPKAQLWYKRYWAGLDNPNQYPDALALAKTGDLYQLGRYVNVHVTLMLQAFRYTGDLRLLDKIDTIMQAARSQLKDYNGDGYVNWRWLHNTSDRFYGTDYQVMDEEMTASLVAAVAWAYQNNRDLKSPDGVNYAERADFWKNYLVNDFEAKWRARNGVPYPQMNYLDYYLMHPLAALTRYYWYMYRLTGKQPYLTAALARATTLKANLHTVSTSYGPAYVWPLGVVTEGNDSTTNAGLMPVVYGQYIVQAVDDLVLDGFPGFNDGNLKSFANGTAAFIINDGTTSYAASVGGDSSVGGVPFNPNTATSDKGPDFWDIWAYAPALASSDNSGKIASNAEALNQKMEFNVDDPKSVFMSGALFDYYMANGQ